MSEDGTAIAADGTDTTFPRLLAGHARVRPARTAIREKDLGIWLAWTWSQVADEVRRYFPTETLATVIPRSVRVSEAPSYGQSVITYHAGSAGAVAYLRVAEEITQRAETRTA